MAPLRMSEMRANELLLKWEPAGVRASLDSPRIHRGEFYHPAIQVSQLWTKFTTINEACEKASKLRRYLEGLLLLSCCRGFDPEENPSFWRRYFADRMSVVTHKITRGLFTSIEVASEPDVDPEIIATTLRVLLSTGHAAQARSHVENELELYVERAPLPLEIKLLADQPSILVTRRGLQRLGSQTTPDNITPAVQVVVESSHPLQRTIGTGEDMKELLDISSIPCVQFDEVHLVATDFSSTDFSALMRELVRRNTVRSMSWDFTYDADNVAALCSALSELTALTSLAIVCRDCRNSETDDPSETDSLFELWRWLNYALKQRKLRGLSLSLELRVTESSRWPVVDAFQRTSGLEVLVPARLFSPEVPIFLPHGATAMLAQGTIAAPLGDISGASPVMMHAPQRVNLVAQGGSKAIVVVPGVGLMTTPLSTLQSWHHTASRGKQFTAWDGFLVDSLVCHESDPENVVKILKVLGANLTHLGFFRCSCIEAEVLRNVILECPKLTKLAVVFGELATLEPLIDAYKRHETHIRTLICQPGFNQQTIPDEHVGGVVEQCVNALATRGHPMASIVRELHFETIGLHPRVLERLSLAVRENKRLEFLCVTPSDEEAPEREQKKAFLDILVNQSLLQNERSRLALYTFLLAVRRKRVLREVPTPCLEIVAQFAAIPVRRCVSLY